MENTVIESSSLYKFEHYKYGEPFFGSFKGMRYRLAREPLVNVIFKKEIEDDPVFLAEVWPEPFSYDNTDSEKIKSKRFPFTEGGFEAAAKWLNSAYGDYADEWDKALKNGIMSSAD